MFVVLLSGLYTCISNLLVCELNIFEVKQAIWMQPALIRNQHLAVHCFAIGAHVCAACSLQEPADLKPAAYTHGPHTSTVLDVCPEGLTCAGSKQAV